MPGPLLGLASSPDPRLDDDAVLRLVRAALEPLGGIRAFVRGGNTVLLKPNQTMWLPAESGATTDPRVVAALVALCAEAGAGRIVVGDGSGGDVRSALAMEATGLRAAAIAAGADDVVGLEDLPQEEVAVDVDGREHAVPVPKLALDADVLINVPKTKTHFEDLVSCALRNWLGLVDQARRPRWMADPLLAKVTCALHRALPAHVTVVDGLWAGEGDGPLATRGAWLGCVLAGRDPAAVDATVAKLMGLDPAGLVYAAEAARIGVGTAEPSRIRVAGPRVEDVAIRAAPARSGFAHLPVRVLPGDGVALAGSLGAVKAIADAFARWGLWEHVVRQRGRPTFMVGRTTDPAFEEHLAEGPYVVVDDAADARYKDDPRVTFVPGHPVTHTLAPMLWKALDVPRLAAGLAGPEAAAGRWLHLEGGFHHRGWARPARAGQGGEAPRGPPGGPWHGPGPGRLIRT